jgi:hypothetical protein
MSDLPKEQSPPQQPQQPLSAPPVQVPPPQQQQQQSWQQQPPQNPWQQPLLQPPLPYQTDHQQQPKYDPVLGAMIPIGRSGWAIAAGYLGIFSVLLIFAPFAILTGILALRDIAANPEKHGKGRALFGIIMGTLGTALLVWMLIAFASERK